jgi:hypothetical protein
VGQRGATQPDAGRVEDGVGQRRGDPTNRALAAAGGRQFGAFDQHDINRFRRFCNVQDRVAEPVNARDLSAVEDPRDRIAAYLSSIGEARRFDEAAANLPVSGVGNSHSHS